MSELTLKTNASSPSITAISLKLQWSREKLDKLKGNYPKWACNFKTYITLARLYDYVFDPPTKPSQYFKPKAHKNWANNDRLTCTTMTGAVNDAEQEYLITKKGARECWLEIQNRHQNEGPVKQVTLLHIALSTKCSLSEPLPTTVKTICDAIDRAFVMGELTSDILKCIAILNSLDNDRFEISWTIISDNISKATKENPYGSNQIRTFLENRQTIIDAKKSNQSQPNAIALVATSTSQKSKIPTCSNCEQRGQPCRGHTQPYCISEGGGMAGKTIAESRVARLTNQGKTPKAQPSDNKGKISISLRDKNRRAFTAYIDPSELNTELPKSEFAGLASMPVPNHSILEDIEWEGWIVMEGGAHTKLNWNKHTKSANESTFTSIAPLQQSHHTTISTESHPFYLDSGATVHISPEKTDFQMLKAIPPWPVKGISRSSIIAISMGNIRLHIARGSYIILKDILYIPNSTIQIISVSALSIVSGMAMTFDEISIKITNKSTGTFIASGPLIPSKHLYSLELHAAQAEHHVLTTQHSPNLETWHCCLGHANYQAITEMAWKGTITGMPTSFTSKPPKCESCILGKQTKMPVPKK